MPRIVISLTTIPAKYPKLKQTLESLHAQTYKVDAIYLSLPKRMRRMDVEYPPLPEDVKSLCTVVECIDYGPITKILGGLLAEKDPETVIITADDDMVIPETMVEELMKRHAIYPDSALGSSGMLLKHPCPVCAIFPNENTPLYRVSKFYTPSEGRRVDSVFGYPLALYVRKFFPRNEDLEEEFLKPALINLDMLLNDDITISGYLSTKNIERRIFPDMPAVDFVKNDGVRERVAEEISYDLDKFFQRMNRAITKSKEIGMYETTEPMDISETVVGVAAIAVLSILILAILVIFIFYRKNALTNPFL